MDTIEGSNRNQLILFPQSLDEYISEDNPVRFIDAFVESLDLKALRQGGRKEGVEKQMERPRELQGELRSPCSSALQR